MKITSQTESNATSGGDFFSKHTVFPKLTINQPHDRYEQEADAMADSVSRMESGRALVQTSSQPIQRKCADCKEEVHRMPLMRRVENGSDMEVSAEFSQRLNTSKGGGSQLPMNTQQRMGQAFGTDFSSVRVHTGSRAAQMSQDIQAKAFTHGSDIYFNRGQYQPGTAGGDHLLAHELTHTVQQGSVAASGSTVMKSNDSSATNHIQRTSDERFESGSGLDTAINDNTMTADAIMGTTVTANDCRGIEDCDIGFKFSKAYKGVYPYAAADKNVRGIYVKIESDYDHTLCESCDQIRFIQTVQNVTQGTDGNMVTADPGTETRRERSGWDDADAPSRGWRVDRVSSSTRPFYGESTGGSAGFNLQIGTPSQPAILWDAPGDWETDSNAGKDFQTFLVCETAAGNRRILAGVSWGYYTDSAGTINFRPSTPIATCGSSQEIQDAATRWDGISGNQATDIDFANTSPAPIPQESGDYGGVGAGIGAGIGALGGGIGGVFAGMALEQSIGAAGAIGAGIGIGLAGAGLGALVGWGIGSLFDRDNE